MQKAGLMNIRKSIASLGVIACTLMPLSAMAAESEWAKGEFLQTRILTGTASKDGSFPAALEIHMEPDWHIYWRTPGDGGLPPMLDWEGSKNFKDAVIQWPAPLRFEYEGLYGFGYKDMALLPLNIVPEKSGEDISLKVHADIMVCKLLCVPQKVDLTLDIPASAAPQAETDRLVSQAFSSLPVKEDQAAMKIENVVLGPKALVARVYLANGFDGADLFAEVGPEMTITAKPEFTIDEKDPHYASVVVNAPEGATDNLADFVTGKTLVLTLTSKGQALERSFKF
jgi:suppressor for copper-sensitivity B